jgi:hypothetical protein
MRRSDSDYLDKVAELGCIVCRNLGYGYSAAEIHHKREGTGLMRANHREVIPLCPMHHRIGGHGTAIHAGRKTWVEKFGTEVELIEQVKHLLGE